MKIDVYAEIYQEDFPKLAKDNAEELDLLLSTINTLGRNLNLLGRQSLSLSDNVQADLKTITLDSSATLPVVIGNRFSPQVPKAVLVANTTQPLNVGWSMNEQNGIQITSLLGTPTYPVTLTLLILW